MLSEDHLLDLWGLHDGTVYDSYSENNWSTVMNALTNEYPTTSVQYALNEDSGYPHRN